MFLISVGKWNSSLKTLPVESSDLIPEFCVKTLDVIDAEPTGIIYDERILLPVLLVLSLA